MSILVEKASRNDWVDGYDSESAKGKARTVLMNFDKWLSFKGHTEEEFFSAMRDADATTRARTLGSIGDYWIQHNIAARSAAQYRNCLLSWLEENDIVISESKLRRLAKLPKVTTEMKYTPDATHILKIVSMQKHLDVATFYVMLSCTAMRGEELLQTKLKDVDLTDRMIRIPAERVKTRTERLTFFTPEARRYLKRLIKEENLTPEDHLFKFHWTNYNWHMNHSNEILGYTERFKTGRYKMSIHRLRAYAKQCIMSATNENFAEVIKGDISGMRTYDIGNIKKMKKDYDKCIKELTLDKTQELEDLKEVQSGRSEQDLIVMREIDNLKMEISRLKDSEEK